MQPGLVNKISTRPYHLFSGRSDEKLDQLFELFAKSQMELSKSQLETSERLKSLLKAQDQLSKSQLETSERFNSLQHQLSKSQLETSERFNSLQDQLSKSQLEFFERLNNLLKAQDKTDKQLKQLIGYNSKRDQELEDSIEEAIIRKLRNSDWIVSRADFTEILRDDRRKLLEWDGILIAHNEKLFRNVIIVIETKQIFTVATFEEFQARLVKMKKAMDKANPENELWPFKNYELFGIIASPVIRSDVNLTNISYVKLTNEQFDVVLCI